MKPRTHRTENAAQSIGKITKGQSAFALTGGQYSYADVIEHICNEIGDCSLDCATWTAHEADLRRIQNFLQSGRLSRVRFLFDPSFRSRKPVFCDLLQRLFGNDCIRTVPIHAKYTVMRNAAFDVCLITSMNLNQNKRIEFVEIHESKEMCDFFEKFTDGIFESESAPTHSQSRTKTMQALGDTAKPSIFGPTPRLL